MSRLHAVGDSLLSFVRLISLVGMLAIVGCGVEAEPDWKEAVAPVSGSVLVKGQPAADVFITFHPMEPSVTGITPRAQSDSQGRFTVSTYETGDGAPVGKYRLSFSWLGVIEGMREEEYEKLPEKLPRKYLNPKSSGIEIDVIDGENVLVAIDLS